VTDTGRRVLGVDLGQRRIGLAITDLSGVRARPHNTQGRSGDPADDHQVIVDTALGLGAGRIVVGLPRSLSGELGRAARSVLAEVAELSARAEANGLEVDTYDERFTTMIAQRNLREATPRRTKRRRRQREEVDAEAASVILQSWLDARPSDPTA
jgi:putative Holliday junction resolvase